MAFVHDALLYDSDEEFLATAVPFLSAGTAAGRPTILAVNPRLQALALDALGDTSRLTVFDGNYRTPLTTLRQYHVLFSRYASAGVEEVRVIGQVPVDRTSWSGWARYEAAINHFYAPFPVRGICPYDTRVTPDDVLDDVARTHRGSGCSDVERVLAAQNRAAGDPLESERPALELHDPLPADAQRAVVRIARRSGLGATQAQRLGLAAGEVALNALAHGEPPTRLRAWTAPDRVVVTVSDRGTGPDDPYAGLMPRRGEGLGLHIAYQACETTLSYSATEFTVRLVVRRGRESNRPPC